jgi:hypothetical protein
MHDMTLWLLITDALIVVAMAVCCGKARASVVPVRVPSQMSQLKQHCSR